MNGNEDFNELTHGYTDVMRIKYVSVPGTIAAVTLHTTTTTTATTATSAPTMAGAM